MDIKIEQLRTSSTVKNLLTRIKGITSIQNWNVLCRWGFCLSIKQTSVPRMVDEKMDGIEIEDYGHLLDYFWSPATNKRNDLFGGKLDNRISFSLKVINSIR